MLTAVLARAAGLLGSAGGWPLSDLEEAALTPVYQSLPVRFPRLLALSGSVALYGAWLLWVRAGRGAAGVTVGCGA
jgi:hypothetical protein